MEILTQWALPKIYIIIGLITAVYFYGICAEVIQDRQKRFEYNGYEKALRLPVSIMMGIFWPLFILMVIYRTLKEIR